MTQARGVTRDQAVVLVINDKPNARDITTDRLYAAGVGKVEAPASSQLLFDILPQALPPGCSPFSLVILDYLLADWGIEVNGVLERLRESIASKGAPIVVLTAFPEGARNNPSLWQLDIVDALAAGPTGIEEIVEKFIG